MIPKNNKSQEGIILIITSFNQLNNFLSFFLEKKLIGKKKIYLIIFSNDIPEKLISYLREYIEKFAIVEVIDMRRKSIKFKHNFLNIRLFKVFYYYLFVLKKILEIKKSTRITYLTTYSKIQFQALLFMIFLARSKIFIIEDGIANYIFHPRYKKISTSFYLLKKFLMLNKSRIFILKLAKSRTDYSGLLSQLLLREENYFDNREVYKKFIENSLDKKLFIKPKCILIATKHLPHTFEYYKNLYIKTLFEMNKKYHYSPEQILFFPHPREESVYIEELVKTLSSYSNIANVSSIVVENYLSQNNLETVVGTFSSALYYAKSIFNKNHVYYIDNFKEPNENNENHDKYVRVFHSMGIKNFLIN